MRSRLQNQIIHTLLAHLMLISIFTLPILLVHVPSAQALYRANDADASSIVTEDSLPPSSPQEIPQGIVVKLKRGVKQFTPHKLNRHINLRDKKALQDWVKQVKVSPLRVTEMLNNAQAKAKNPRKAALLKSFGFDRLRVLSWTGKVDARAILPAVRAMEEVEYAELDVHYHVMTTNDPLLSRQWAVQNYGQDYPVCPGGTQTVEQGNPGSDAAVLDAWNVELPVEDVVVAVIDTGIDFNHPDLQGKLWVNSGEIPDNGIDDDGNGYIDDYHGFNFVSNTGNAIDDFGHGTHCAGIIGAVQNNATGIAGVSPAVKFMSVKFLDSSGSGSLSAAVDSITYAANNGAQVLSNSWGGGGYSQLLQDAITYARTLGCSVIASAGNSGDSSIMYPASYDGVVSVAASDSTDHIASFSTYNEKVDISAPGVNILSLRAAGTDMYGDGCHTVDNDYYIASGTSMACPHVSGAVAYLASIYPNETAEEWESRLLYTAEPIEENNDKYIGKIGTGRLNLAQALLSSPHPFFTLQDYQINDVVGNGDGLAQAGETVGFQFTIKNHWKDAEGLVATLELTDPTYLTITGPPASKSFDAHSRGGTSQGKPRGASTPDKDVQAMMDSSSVMIHVMYDADSDTTTLSWPPELGNNSAYSGPYWVYRSSSRIFSPTDLLDAANMPLPTGTTSYIDTTPSNSTLTYYAVLVNKLEDDPGTATVGLVNSGSTVVTSNIYVAISSNHPVNTLATVTLVLTDEISGYVQRIPFSFIVSPVITGKPGWPVTVGTQVWSSAAAADMDGDGFSEVVVGTDDGDLYMLNHDGSIATGWPVHLSTKSLRCSPAIGDLNGDGNKEIVVTTIDSVQKLFVLDAMGNMVSGWPQTLQGTYLEGGSATLADLDGDGTLEIVVGTMGIAAGNSDAKLYAFNYDGTLLSGFPQSVASDFWGFNNTPVTADLDKDGDLEIIAGGSNGKVYAWHHDGTAVTGWPGQGCTIWSSPAVGDVDSDTNPELVFDCNFGYLFMLKANGTIAPGFPIPTGSGASEIFVSSSPALADIDGDGAPEIIIAQVDGKIYAFNEDGTAVPNFPLTTNSYLISSVVVVDIDNDNEPEIIVGGDDGNLYGFNADGTEITDGDHNPNTVGVMAKATSSIYSTVVIEDTDKDGTSEIVVGCYDGTVHSWVYDATPNPSTQDWSRFRKDNRHSGTVN